MKKILTIFLAGLFEQFGFTLYLLSVTHSLILVSSMLMFVYFLTYLLIVNYAVKDSNSVVLMVTYAAAASVGNWAAMTLHLIK